MSVGVFKGRGKPALTQRTITEDSSDEKEIRTQRVDTATPTVTELPPLQPAQADSILEEHTGST